MFRGLLWLHLQGKAVIERTSQLEPEDEGTKILEISLTIHQSIRRNILEDWSLQ
jgi:hypothetical protein